MSQSKKKVKQCQETHNFFQYCDTTAVLKPAEGEGVGRARPNVLPLWVGERGYAPGPHGQQPAERQHVVAGVLRQRQHAGVGAHAPAAHTGREGGHPVGEERPQAARRAVLFEVIFCPPGFSRDVFQCSMPASLYFMDFLFLLSTCLSKPPGKGAEN